MTPEQQRITLAEWDGYTGCKNVKCAYRKAQHLHKGDWVFFPEPYSTMRYPDYLNDLNAVHELEKKLTEQQGGDYDMHLWLIIKRDKTRPASWHATAAQRCEALLRTNDLWKEGA